MRRDSDRCRGCGTLGHIAHASKPWPSLVFVVVALVLASPSLAAGLWFDDLVQQRIIEAVLAGEADGRAWDLFELVRADPPKIFGGQLPWWTDPELRIAFFRPLAAATHYLDYLVWPNTPWLMHAHSLMYFAVLVLLAHRIYRRLQSSPRAVAIATLVFAGSYVHLSAVGWVANRNALLAAMFGLLAFELHVSARQRDRSVLGGASVFAMALASAEAGVAALAFVGAYELFVSRPGHGWRRALTGIAPYVVVLMLWRIVYGVLGYGARGSGAYLDPIGEPMAFLIRMPERLWAMTSLALVPLRVGYIEGDAPWVTPEVTALGGVVFAIVVLGVWSSWRRDPTLRLWTLAFVGALLPFVASVPGERILTPAMFAAAPLLASAILELLASASRWRRLLALGLAGLHLVVSPALLFGSAFDLGEDLQGYRRLGLELGPEERMAAQSLVIVHAPSNYLTVVMAKSRERAGRPKPAFRWILAATPEPVTIERNGCCTLELSSAQGFVREPWSAFFRGCRTPLRPGDVVRTLSFTAEVLATVDDCYPSRVRFVFTVPLEHPSVRLVHFADADFRPYVPPPPSPP